MEDCCLFYKDNFITKSQKKYPLVMWLVALALIMIGGVYASFLFLNQGGLISIPYQLKFDVVKKPCQDPSIPPSELPFVHYPEPSTYSREECACTPVRFFTILSMQRSGSGWFETLLNSHINVSSNGEIFSVKERRSNISSITKTLNTIYNLDWYSSAAKNECTNAVGLKWMLNQGLMQHHENITNYFIRRGVHVIILLRRNLLQRLVSILANEHDRDAKQLNGTHKAHVHSKDEADLLARYKPTINATSLIPEIKHTKKLGVDALEYFKSTRHILLYYEDLVNNQTKLMDVLDFLKLPKRKLSSRHVKIHKQPLSNQIENWGAVYNVLKGTEYQSYLNADY